MAPNRLRLLGGRGSGPPKRWPSCVERAQSDGNEDDGDEDGGGDGRKLIQCRA